MIGKMNLHFENSTCFLPLTEAIKTHVTAPVTAWYAQAEVRSQYRTKQLSE